MKNVIGKTPLIIIMYQMYTVLFSYDKARSKVLYTITKI